jgi:hypothetical protein
MSLSSNYKDILDNAIKAIHDRGFWAQYPEHPKAYGDEAATAGLDVPSITHAIKTSAD